MESNTILIVDDDIDLLMLLERDLKKHGYLVETAVSISEAEDFLAFHAPSVILLDININGEDGRQLCWKLKKNTKSSARVIIMSGYDASLSRSILFGADDFIAKPFDLEFLHLKLQAEFKAISIGNGAPGNIDQGE